MPFRLATVLFLSIMLAGCLDYEERIVIGRDGSAKIELQLRVARTIQSVVRKNPAFSALAMLMDPDTLRKNLPEGVALAAHRQIPSTGRLVFTNELFAADASKLTSTGASLFQGQKFEVATLPDGSLRYRRSLDFTASGRDPEIKQMIDENRMGIVGILKNAKFQFSLESPLKILSTNGRVEGSKVAWDYVLFDLLHEEAYQEVILAAPTNADKVIGAIRLAFRPKYFPILAAVCLAAFFAVSFRRTSAQP